MGELVAVGAHHATEFTDVDGQGDLRSRQRAERVGLFVDLRGEVDRHGPQQLASAEGEQLPRQDRGAVGRVADRFDIAAPWALRRQLGEHEFGRDLDLGQQVVELMRHTAGQPLHGLQPLIAGRCVRVGRSGRHVGRTPDEADKLPPGAEPRRRRGEHRTVLAVDPAETILDRELLATGQRDVDCALDDADVLVVRVGGQAAPERFTDRATGQLDVALVDPHQRPGRVEDPDGKGGGVREVPERFFALGAADVGYAVHAHVSGKPRAAGAGAGPPTVSRRRGGPQY